MPVLKAICIALSTYSILPAPRCEWTAENMRGAICALPLVGVVIGALLLLWHYLSMTLGLSPLLFACVATVLPLLITGGIHMDGFCDTVDALASQQPQERKLEILRDPRVGAFAVIYCAAYLLLGLGLYAELYGSQAIFAVGAGFMLSRALTALSALMMKNARNEGMLASFAQPAHKKTACLISVAVALLSGTAMIFLSLWAGIIGVILCLLTLIVYRRLTFRQFGGITGDTSGFFLQLCELAVLFSALAANIAEGLA